MVLPHRLHRTVRTELLRHGVPVNLTSFLLGHQRLQPLVLRRGPPFSRPRGHRLLRPWQMLQLAGLLLSLRLRVHRRRRRRRRWGHADGCGMLRVRMCMRVHMRWLHVCLLMRLWVRRVRERQLRMRRVRK